MKRNVKIASALSVSFFLLMGCIKDQEPLPDARTGLVVVNSFMEAQAVLHRLDVGRGLQNLDQGQGYRGIDYYAVPSYEKGRLVIVSSNANAQLVDTVFALLEDEFYTSFLYGTEAAPQHFIAADRIPDGVEDPALIAAVRFFNLAVTNHRVTLHIGEAAPAAAYRDRPIETPATGKAAESFIEVANTGTHVLTVRDQAGNLLARRTGVALDPGDFLSVFLTGDDSDSAPFYIGIVRHRGLE